MSDVKAQPKRKAKRRLSDFDFSSETAHVALVDQAANERTALVVKSVKFTEEEIEKIQQIKVTMELPDFLQKFFHMYYEDAEVLAKLMGYVESEDESEAEEDSYESYIESRMEAFEIIKSLSESTEISSVLSELDADSYISLLRDQQRLEKAFKKESAKVEESTEANSSTEVNSEVGADTEVEVQKAKVKSGDFVSWSSSGGTAYGKVSSVKTSGSIRVNENVSVSADADDPAALITVYKKNSEGGWEPTDVKVAHKTSTLKKISALKKATVKQKAKVELEENMTEQVQETTVAEFEIEVVEKSKLEAVEKAAQEAKVELEKALEKQKEELQKALELVKQFEQEKKEAIEKAKFEQIKTAVKDEAKAEVLFKAAKLLSDDAEFEAVVKALKDMADLAEQGELFVEKGVNAEGKEADGKKDSAVAKLLKAQNAKQK